MRQVVCLGASCRVQRVFQRSRRGRAGAACSTRRSTGPSVAASVRCAVVGVVVGAQFRVDGWMGVCGERVGVVVDGRCGVVLRIVV